MDPRKAIKAAAILKKWCSKNMHHYCENCPFGKKAYFSYSVVVHCCKLKLKSPNNWDVITNPAEYTKGGADE